MADQHVFLTVPEVMARLRLSRTTVYEQARLYLATGGAEGLPCRRFGRSLRFPAAALDCVATTFAPAKHPVVTQVTESRRPRRAAHHAEQLHLLPPS